MRTRGPKKKSAKRGSVRRNARARRGAAKTGRARKTKKRTTRRKAPRRKASRRTTKPGTTRRKVAKTSTRVARTPLPNVCDITVILVTGSPPTPKYPRFSKKTPEGICWYNQDAIQHTLKFTTWPFRQTAPPGNTITVLGNSGVGPYHLKTRTVKNRTYSYHVSPQVDPNGPPNDPGVIPDD